MDQASRIPNEPVWQSYLKVKKNSHKLQEWNHKIQHNHRKLHNRADKLHNFKITIFKKIKRNGVKKNSFNNRN
jgi:hypothetical protein